MCEIRAYTHDFRPSLGALARRAVHPEFSQHVAGDAPLAVSALIGRLIAAEAKD